MNGDARDDCRGSRRSRGTGPGAIAQPVPQRGQVRIKVAFVGMNLVDAPLRRERRDWMPVTYPFVPGTEHSGIVDAVGEGVDATLVSQAGAKTQNTFSTNNRQRIGRKKKNVRYNKKKIVYKKCHSFTFGLLITPSGIRIPFQIPHYTKEYCAEHKVAHRTTAEAAPVAAAIGVFAAVAGVFVSYYLTIASGPAVGLVATAIFRLVLVLAGARGRWGPRATAAEVSPS